MADGYLNKINPLALHECKTVHLRKIVFFTNLIILGQKQMEQRQRQLKKRRSKNSFSFRGFFPRKNVTKHVRNVDFAAEHV